MLFFQVTLVLLAFAANSLLCRWALAEYQFDAALFSATRLFSGAMMLTVLMAWLRPATDDRMPWASVIQSRRFWLLGAFLATYVVGFSWAYLQLDTGTGAFILFATVQLAMQLAAYWQGVRLSVRQYIGILVSALGLAALLLPGSEAPHWLAAFMMVIAALGWTGFVVLAKASDNALRDVHQAFIAASLLVMPLTPVLFGDWQPWSPAPWWLALLSGALASGVGYFLWYRLLPQLGLNRAAQCQLLVPVIAMLMGVILLGETLSLTALLAMLVICTGVALATLSRPRTIG